MPIRFLVAILLSLAVFADPEATAPGPAVGLGSLAAAVTLVALAGLGLWVRLALRARSTPGAEALFAWHGRASAVHAWLAIAVYAAVLYAGQWPQTVFAWLPPWMGTDLWLPQRLLILTPFLLLVLVTWTIGHRMSLIVRRAAEAEWEGERVTERAAVGLPRYLLFQARTQLLIFVVPYVFVLACQNAAVLANGGPLSANAEMIVLASPMMLVYVLSPWLLRVVWSTSRMEDGPLRDRLEQVARRAGVYVREIIVWRTGGLMVNACVAGLGRPLRYVFLTDTLIHSMQPVQVEAVFAHELGHARFRHIPFFFIVALGGGLGMSVVAAVLDALSLPEWATLAGSLLFLVVYWLGFFGFLSRRFERQSDLFAARTVDCPGHRAATACQMHQPDAPHEDPYLICGNQAWAFTSALQQIAMLNGTAARARSWRHFGIQRRVQYIADAVGRPDAVRRYDRRLRLFKWLFAFGVLLLLVAVIVLGIPF